MYVHGEILYVDAFKRKRFTRYRLMHHLFRGVIGVSTDLTLTEGGNKQTSSSHKSKLGRYRMEGLLPQAASLRYY